MSNVSRRRWRVPAWLIFLGILPIAASLYRIAVLIGTDPATVTNTDELRFFAQPVSIALHVIFAVAFLVLGAFQFVPHLRIGTPSLHRLIGYGAAVSGIIFALSGVYMVVTYPPHSLANPYIDIARIVLGLAIPVMIALGIIRAIRRELPAHRAWMIRAYALAASSGAQSWLIAVAMLINGGFDATLADTMMWLGWAIGVLAAEWVIHRQPRQHRARSVS